MTDIALFDLDNTLLNGDSDYAWGEFACEAGLVEAAEFRRCNRFFYRQYVAGQLDIFAYLQFALRPLAAHSNEKLLSLRKNFIDEKIKPLITKTEKDLVAKHKKAGDITVIITATNRFITEPIAQLFEVDDLIATEVEVERGRFTGNPTGTPCFQAGKVERLVQWLGEVKPSYQKIWFYSDSINDLALLEYVDCPVIKNGDDAIIRIAKDRNWKIIP